METKPFIDKIREAKSDMELVGLLLQMFDLTEMPVLVAALPRTQELALIQAGVLK